MNRYAVLVSIKSKRRKLKIVRFLKVATSFIYKARKEPVNENDGDELGATRKRKQEHCQRSADSLTTPEFVRRVHGMMDGNPGKSMRDILPNIFKCLQEQ
ncbi:hypothetical protein ACTXT7_016955 [Hymenolepis weldensis]